MKSRKYSPTSAAACAPLARGAGLTVPNSTLQKIGRSRALLVRRFDVTEQNGRLHMVRHLSLRPVRRTGTSSRATSCTMASIL